jgi:hypothetical protein
MFQNDQPNGINTANPNGQLQWRRNMDTGNCECFVSMPGAFGFVKYNQAPGFRPDVPHLSKGFAAFSAWVGMGFEVLQLRESDRR